MIRHFMRSKSIRYRYPPLSAAGGFKKACIIIPSPQALIANGLMQMRWQGTTTSPLDKLTTAFGNDNWKKFDDALNNANATLEAQRGKSKEQLVALVEEFGFKPSQSGSFADALLKYFEPRDSALPFDLNFLNNIPYSSIPWDDNGKGLTFTGRGDFTSAVKRSMDWLIKCAPSQTTKAPSASLDSKTTRAVVYSTVSGSGKTVSMLELKRTLPPEFPNMNLVVAYLGFNGNLRLGDEEEKHIRAWGGAGASEVLARRLLGSVFISNFNPKEITTLPRYEDVYNGRTFPTVGQCRDMLQSALNVTQNTPLCIVAGVDEVQMLNMFMKVGDARLGRLFLRILREWQLSWYNHGFRILALGTGIAIDWGADPTHGVNTPLVDNNESDEVLITTADFKELVVEEVNKLSDATFEDRFSPTTSRETIIDLMAAVYWPRVRLLEWWRDRRDLEVSNLSNLDANNSSWLLWLQFWMCDKSIHIARYPKAIPGQDDPEGRIIALFQLQNVESFKVIPDGYCSSAIVSSLRTALCSTDTTYSLDHLFSGLNVIRSMQPKKFIREDAYTFEDFGFHVVGVSMHLGLLALSLSKKEQYPGEQEISGANATEVQKKRLQLALWLKEQEVETQIDPFVLMGPKDSTTRVGDFYPFVDNNQQKLEPSVLSKLEDKSKAKQPVYIRCGRRTCCDYLYLYWRVGGNQKPECVAVICDAKHTQSRQGKKADLTGSDQQGLFEAVVLVYKAFNKEEEKLPPLVKVRPLFVTNRDYVGTPYEAEEKARDEAKELFPSLELEVLNRKNFDFGPFTSVLFARRA